MPNRLDLPDELLPLIEKRENADRRVAENQGDSPDSERRTGGRRSGDDTDQSSDNEPRESR